MEASSGEDAVKICLGVDGWLHLAHVVDVVGVVWQHILEAVSDRVVECRHDVSSSEGVGVNTPAVTALNTANSTTTLGTTVSQTVVGTVLNLRATTVNTLFQTYTQLQATLTIVGRDSGARQTIPVTVTKTA